MEDSSKEYKGVNSEAPNNPAHYTLLTVAIAIIIVGLFLRFFSQWEFINLASNLIFLVGVFFALKAVLRILK